ncbi:MAG TPA: HipA domain-containing protein [Ferruginibacter sp.]|jgi:serine/threonine-protein kinase HipA|nr:HipA domain-containing protein [Ferruginibacter sp.]
MAGKTDIYVYAHWVGMNEPKCIGVLSAQQAKGRKAFSFEYDKEWINSKEQLLLDPDIAWYSGTQYPNGKENFGVFMDSMPDTWGRTLMKRRAAQLARDSNKNAPVLYDIDFLLGVYDESRMGALRFKLNPNGSFLDDNKDYPTPHWSNVRELQHGAAVLESDEENEEVRKWLSVLIAPGSSLGGARPKANILDDHGHPWIAKFPAKADAIDKAAWEYLAYKLALEAGIDMTESRIEKVSGRHHTFFTKRFDRLNGERVHFASAMTMTGNNEDTIKDHPASYLDLAEFIQYSGSNNKSDLHQLWKRIVFNIAVSNTDDHLRNHGFILKEDGWRLSPAYDINPSIDKEGLALNIDAIDNLLSFDLAKSVGEYFQLDEKQMNIIINEVLSVIKNWSTIATQIGISRAEQELMAKAFRFK